MNKEKFNNIVKEILDVLLNIRDEHQIEVGFFIDHNDEVVNIWIDNRLTSEVEIECKPETETTDGDDYTDETIENLQIELEDIKKRKEFLDADK